MSEILDNIVNCSISIESPVEDGASFGTILIIGDTPAKKGEHFRDTDKYASLPEVMDAGWLEADAVYQAAAAAFGQEPGPQIVYIAVRRETETEGTLEDFSETVKRSLEKPGWYGLALAGAQEEDCVSAAELVETAEKIFSFSTDKMENPLSGKEFMRTFGIHSEDPYANVAWMAAVFSLDPGSETWAYKTLKGVVPSELTTREMRLLDENGLNYYVACAGRNITRDGKMAAGEWIDIIRFRDWLKNQMQIRIYELFVKNPKIPYTDAGIALVENQMEAVLASGQKTGGIAETEYDENDDPVYGYTVSVPLAARISSEQKARRVLKDCRFTARLAGAIHVTELKGNLVY